MVNSSHPGVLARLANRLVQVLKGMTATVDGIDQTLLDAKHFDTHFATRDELIAALSDAELAEEMTGDFVDQAVSRGDQCYVIYDGPKLVSLGWYSNHPTHLSDELTLSFDRSWMYMYKGYTLRSHRGKRLHGIGMTKALYTYTERGARGLIGYVRSTNVQSLRSAENMGYRTFGEIYIAKAIGRPRIWATRGCAAYDFKVEYRQS